jgi:hypothetical protein
MTRTGRPREFKRRKSLMVLLEADELAALHTRAEASDVSASAFVRGLILRALARPPRRKKERTP